MKPITTDANLGTAYLPHRAHTLRVPAWLVFVLLLMSALAHSSTIRSGHGGHWYDPARDGEGLVLELLDDGDALLYWFTYNEQGRQRWLTAVGHIAEDDDGEYLDFPILVLTRGGRFGPDFDPDLVEREAVGSATLRFSGCDHGQFQFDAFDQQLALEIERLTPLMGSLCESRNGMPGHPIAEHAGQSGSWFDPSHDGEGYSLQWISPETALITWYSFDPEGEPYWMLGTGTLQDDGSIHAPQMHAARGARFGSDFDPEDVERYEWGALTLQLACDDGDASYESVLTPFGSGSLDLVRLTVPRGLGCPWQAPSLTDQYAITVTEMPLAGDEDDAVEVRMQAVADDGTVYGTDAQGRIHIWHADTDTTTLWLDDVPAADDIPWLKISRNGDTLLRGGLPTPMLYRVDEGWIELEEVTAAYDSATAFALSSNGEWVGGSGVAPGADHARPWVWNATEGLYEPPLTDEVSHWLVASIANDGSVVLGEVYHSGGSQGPRPYHAVVSVDGGAAEPLYDADLNLLGPAQVCNDTCQIIFGSYLWGTDLHSNEGQAWYWLAAGSLAYLGRPAGTGQPGSSLRIWVEPSVVSADGSMMAGQLHVLGFSPRIPSMTILWTQLTGTANLNDLEVVQAALDEGWRSLLPVAMSGSGEYLLLRAQYGPSVNSLVERELLLHLRPLGGDRY